MDPQLLLSNITNPTLLFRSGAVVHHCLLMALGLAFPLSILLGMPMYLALFNSTP